MFVQVIQGKVRDADRLRAQSDKWLEELAPGAEGWLGMTEGITADGEAIAMVRFESEEAAQKNSDRPEQGQWWEETKSCYEGEPQFLNSRFADAETYGDPSRAGFVQIMQGEVSDLDRAHSLMSSEAVDLSAMRPDILGTVFCGHDDGRYTMEVFFTSEAEARENERQDRTDAPAEVAEAMKEFDSLSVGETRYIDLADPWMYSPR